MSTVHETSPPAPALLDHRRLYRMPWTLPDNVILVPP